MLYYLGKGTEFKKEDCKEANVNSNRISERTIFPENIEFSGISLYSDESIRHHKNTKKYDGS